MTPSPASTIASSGLYPTSEPAEQDAQAEDTQSPVGPEHRLSRSLVEAHELAMEFSADSGAGPNILDKLHGPTVSGSHEAYAISGQIADFPQTSGREMIRTSHKRKRDGDTEYPRSVKGEPSSADPVEHLPYPSRTASVPSASETRDDGDIEPSMDKWSNKKRTRADDVIFGPISRVKLASHFCDLPIGIWQRIFCFVPPVSLGRLLRVNRAFNTCLTTGDTDQQFSKPSHSGNLETLNPDAVWAASRKRFCPGLPKPIRGLLELEMWRLLRGRHCQLCGEIKDAGSNVSVESPWESGPGETGVRVVWPWGVRLCGKCIPIHSEKVKVIPLR